ncbi:hypothetical protein CUU95_00015 [Vreelandella alkaliphila]|uniref:hypothetical protein n=1 Tax=Vreelandella alkaliphila TaxID=272774 RepID=UPI000EA34B96|nr:hypothetical protein [Halomonas alkaliphila]AYF32309.1 hypothetical protein CUU95_00015 [Halomonas alkaliphila]
MSILKPVDHQNIVLRLLARSAACDAQHIATLAHSYKLPVSLHQVRVPVMSSSNSSLSPAR